MQSTTRKSETRGLRRGAMRVLTLLLGLAPTAALADHTTLNSAEGVSYRFDPSESTITDITFPALNDPCSDCNELFVGGNNYDGGNSQSTLDGLERTADVEMLSGLAVSRRTYVSTDNNFLRQVNVLRNDTAADITVNFNYDSGYAANATVVATSSGDAIPDAADLWITTSHTAGFALLAQAWGNAGAADTIDTITNPAGGTTVQTWTWSNVTVPAGQTYIYVTFLAAEADATDAQAAAEAFAAISLADLFFGLEDELPQVRNWAFPDTDGDGLYDFVETSNGLDPNDPADAAGDADSDGLSNLEETQAGTGINEADSDGDGLEDGAEVNTHGSNPLLSDTDADNIDDGGEVAVGLDPVANDFLTGEETLLTDGTQMADQPDFAVDADGNVHLVWSEDDGGDFELRYAMLSAAGAVLIAPTVLTDNADRDRMPDVLAGADGHVYVAWHTSNEEEFLLRLAPATDDQNGDAADPLTLIDVAPVTVSANGRHGHIAADAAGNIHIGWHDTGDDTWRYAKYDAALANLIADTLVGGTGSEYMDYLGLALDSAGNPHFAWTENDNSDNLVYAMLDGSDGSVLIAPTRASTIIDENAKHASITVNSADLVNIVWMDRRTDTAEIYFTQLDPAAAAQDGSAANLADIVVVPETRISPDNGLESLYPHSTLAADDGLLVTWTNDLTEDDEEGNRYGPLLLARFDSAGAPDGGPYQLYDADEQSNVSNLNYYRAANGYAAWSEPAAAGGRQIVLRTIAFTPPGDGPSGTIDVQASAGTVTGAQTLNVSDLPGSAATNIPAGLSLPDGLARFAVTDLAPGQTIVATLTFPNEVPANAAYFKWDINNGWHEVPFIPGATANDIKLVLTDGGAGDADGLANGQIVDPGGYGVGLGFGPQVTVEGTGGGGCTLNPNAPFDPLFPLLLAAALVYFWRRRMAGERE